MEDKCETCEGQGYLICGNCDAFEKLGIEQERQLAAQAEEIAGLKALVREMGTVMEDFIQCSQPPQSLNLQLFRKLFNEIVIRPQVQKLMEGE